VPSASSLRLPLSRAACVASTTAPRARESQERTRSCTASAKQASDQREHNNLTTPRWTDPGLGEGGRALTGVDVGELPLGAEGEGRRAGAAAAAAAAARDAAAGERQEAGGLELEHGGGRLVAGSGAFRGFHWVGSGSTA
jgi:hypothetical protein